MKPDIRRPIRGRWTPQPVPLRFPGVLLTESFTCGETFVLSSLERMPDGENAWHVSISVAGRRPDDRRFQWVCRCFDIDPALEDSHSSRHRELWIKPSSSGDAESLVTTWNENRPPGTDVLVAEDNGRRTVTRTRSPAWLLSNGQPVVQLEGRVGAFALLRLTAITAAEAQELPGAEVPS